MRLLLRLMSLIVVIASAPATGADIQLRIGHRDDGTFDYYHELLTASLTEWGHELTLIPVNNLPQKREVALFEEGHLDIVRLVGSRERDEKFHPVNVGITQGLLGQRVLLVAP